MWFWAPKWLKNGLCVRAAPVQLHRSNYKSIKLRDAGLSCIKKKNLDATYLESWGLIHVQ